jgi:hypothetical protein
MLLGVTQPNIMLSVSIMLIRPSVVMLNVIMLRGLAPALPLTRNIERIRTVIMTEQHEHELLSAPLEW